MALWASCNRIVFSHLKHVRVTAMSIIIYSHLYRWLLDFLVPLVELEMLFWISGRYFLNWLKQTVSLRFIQLVKKSLFFYFSAVEQRDKSISQGLSLSLVSLFAMMPGPIIFGRVIDSTCLIWNFKCGRKGNCQLYDPIMFSYYFHLTSAFFIILGAFFDLLVWYYGLNLKLYGDEEPQKLKKWEGNDESPECQPLNEL